MARKTQVPAWKTVQPSVSGHEPDWNALAKAREAQDQQQQGPHGGGRRRKRR